MPGCRRCSKADAAVAGSAQPVARRTSTLLALLRPAATLDGRCPAARRKPWIAPAGTCAWSRAARLRRRRDAHGKCAAAPPTFGSLIRDWWLRAAVPCPRSTRATRRPATRRRRSDAHLRTRTCAPSSSRGSHSVRSAHPRLGIGATTRRCPASSSGPPRPRRRWRSPAVRACRRRRRRNAVIERSAR